MTKRTKILIGAGAGVVLLAIVGGNVARSKGKATPVQAETVRRGTLVARVRAPGTIQARNTVKVSATTFGQVTRVAVHEGEVVQRGQFLLALDDTQYRAALSEAQAARASAVARLRLSEASATRANANLKRL